MSLVQKFLDRVFPSETLPFGRRWRIAGSFMSPETKPAWLKRPLPWIPDRNLYLHHMTSPDADRDVHDHPWGFVSIVLSGGYEELVRTITGYHEEAHCPWSVLFRSPEFLHRITKLPTGECWTLVFTGKRVRKWGFMKGAFWMPHEM